MLQSNAMPARSGGFSLLEVLVAFVIASLAIGLTIGMAGAALRSGYEASHYQQAALRAQSHLEETVNGNTLMAGEWTGDDGFGYQWRVRVSPSPLVAAHRAGAAASLVLYDVNVWEMWHDGARSRSVHLVSEQIGQAPHTP